MKRLVLTVLLSALSFTLNASELTREQIAKIRELYSQGRGHHENKEYAKSNESFAAVLEALPSGGPDELDLNRAAVLFNIAGNHALLGEKEKAFEALRESVRRGFWDSYALQREPALASLRGNGDFDEIVKKSRAGLGSVAFGLKDLSGKELKKEDYEGKVIVIDIWGTWCPPCRMEIPHFVKLQKEYRKQGLEIIGLTYERREPNEALTKHVASFGRQYGINYPLVMITGARLSYVPNVSGFPTTLFVGRDGTVRERVSGYHPYEDLKAKVTRLLKEKAPSASEVAEGQAE